MGDLLLDADHLHSRYSEALDLSLEQLQSASLRGIGRLRDLREAAALSPALAAVLQAYAQAQTKQEQQALLEQLLQEWAKTDPRYGSSETQKTGWADTQGKSGEGIALDKSSTKFPSNDTYSHRFASSFQIDASQPSMTALMMIGISSWLVCHAKSVVQPFLPKLSYIFRPATA